jgi:hypothetical protein
LAILTLGVLLTLADRDTPLKVGWLHHVSHLLSSKNRKSAVDITALQETQQAGEFTQGRAAGSFI